MQWITGSIVIVCLGMVLAWSRANFMKRDYVPVNLGEVEGNPGRYHGEKVEWTGIFFSMFEVSCIDGKVWLATSKQTVILPEGANLWIGPQRKRVRVRGTLYTKERHYGHMGGYRFLLKADLVEILPGDPQNP